MIACNAISDFFKRKMQEQMIPHEQVQQSPESADNTLSPLEQLIAKTDGEGRYQKQSFVIFAVMWFLTAWLLLGMNFFFDNSYSCQDPDLEDSQKCADFVCSLPPEQRPEAIGSHASSIVFQFEPYLICSDHESTVAILQDMMFVGAIFGFFVIPFIADNFGRRLAMRIAWALGTVSVLLICLADSPNMVGIGLFLVGFGTNPAITLCFSFINEVCLGKSRQRYGVGVQVAWAIGQTTIALVFLTGMTWKAIMCTLFSLFVLNAIAVEFFLFQTPMYLLKKQPEAAFQTLNKMAQVNGRAQLKEQDMETLDHNQDKLDVHPQQKSLGFTDLFKYKSIRWTSISGALIFFGIQAIYYSSTLNGASVGFTKTINQVVFGISEILGYLSAQLVIHWCPRRKATFVGMGLSSAFCLILGVMVIFENDDNRHYMMWLETIALMFNRFFLCCFWSIFFVYVAELYPTEVRSIGFGWTSVVGMLGSAISPFVKTIAGSVGINSWFPPALFGIVTWFFAFCLPETFGKPQKDTIEERIEMLKKEKSELDIDYPDEDDDFECARAPVIRKAATQQTRPQSRTVDTVDTNEQYKDYYSIQS